MGFGLVWNFIDSKTSKNIWIHDVSMLRFARIETSNSMPSLRSASNIEFRIQCGI